MSRLAPVANTSNPPNNTGPVRVFRRRDRWILALDTPLGLMPPRHLPLIAFLASLLLAASPAFAGDPIRPDPALTPGAVGTTDTVFICSGHYARSVRHTSGDLKSLIYREYHIRRRHGHYEVDHLIPLGLGGADVRENLWPESFDTEPWNAARKNDLEEFLHDKVCAGHLALPEAQRAIAADWIAAYRRYLGPR
jgi:hypothetical protein